MNFKALKRWKFGVEYSKMEPCHDYEVQKTSFLIKSRSELQLLTTLRKLFALIKSITQLSRN